MVIESASTAGAGLRRPLWRRLISHRDLHFGAVGLLAYSYVIRFRGLLPTNVTWIFRDATGDVAGFDSTANYLGWEFFRRGDYLTWPIGRSTLLGPEPGASIAMSDSLPLLGIPMKYLTWWTDRPLQYFGMWILICFVLQTIFAGRILQKFISSHTTVLVAASIFPLMPFYLARVGVHTPISGHWIVLAAITLLLSDRLSWWRWSVVVAGAIAIQPYLGAMVLVLLAATLVGSVVEARRVTRESLSCAAAALVSAGVAAHQVGLLIFGGGSLGTDNVGDFSANLLSLVDPEYDSRLMVNPNWSQTGLIRNVADGVYQYEGFGFVGVGVVTLALGAAVFWSAKSRMRAGAFVGCTAALFFAARTLDISFGTLLALAALIMATIVGIRESQLRRSKQVAISLAVIISLLLAVTNHVTLGNRGFSYYWPGFVDEVLSVIRVTGRFIWVVAYGATITTFILASRVIRTRRWLLACVIAAVAFHVFDTRDAMSTQRALLAENRTPTGLEAQLWRNLGERYSRIEIVLPGPTPVIQNPGPDDVQTNYNDDFWFAKRVLWADMSEFAAYRGISLNAFYFGREPMDLHSREGAKLREIVQSNGYRDDTLYVFTDSALWNQAKTVRRSQDVVGLLDGIPIVAPNLRECSACPLDDVSPVRPVGG